MATIATLRLLTTQFLEIFFAPNRIWMGLVDLTGIEPVTS